MDSRSRCTLHDIPIVDPAGRHIVDYSGQDYRAFWEGASKPITNARENRLVARLVQPAPPAEGGWFADIGCGFGRNIPAYSGLLGGRKVVLVDYASNHLLMIAREYPQREDFHYIAADACRLPFRDGVLDGGISIRLFQHLNRPVEFFSSLSRVFRPGSRLVITYFNSRCLFRLMKFGPGSQAVAHQPIAHAYFCTHPRYFEQLCAQAGFSVLACDGSDFIDHLAERYKWFLRFIERHPGSRPMLQSIDGLFSSLLGRSRLSLIEFMALRKDPAAAAGKDCLQVAPQPGGRPTAIEEILRCPRCTAESLRRHRGRILCDACGSIYPVLKGIMDFRVTSGS